MRVLVGYSGSPGSMALVEAAVERARQTGAEVFLVTSLRGHGELRAERNSGPTFGRETPLRSPGPVTERDRRYVVDIDRAEKALEGVCEFFRKKGVACSTHVLIRGLSVGDDLVAFARQKGVDEIMIGIRRRSALSKAIFGSVAREVISEAPCPVVTVRY